ncbi:MAG: YdcF family protein [Lachnospiraceae bacterium]|nr:YdcF family protein [Lachnospiraceae bacterium]
MSVILGFILLFLGLLSIFYGLAMAFGAHGTMFFIIWFIFGAMLILDAILRIKKVTLPSTPLIIIRIVVAVLLVLFIFVEICIFTDFNRKAEPNVDYLIIAGAQVYSTGPSPVLKYRLDASIEYLMQNTDTKCIVTGGKGTNEVRPEAEVMADYLVANGISADRIIIENKSTTTTENMKNAAALFDPSNAATAIVTNNFHLFRSMRIAKKQGIKNLTGIAAGSTLLYLPNNLLREFCGVCKDFLFGHMAF